MDLSNDKYNEEQIEKINKFSSLIDNYMEVVNSLIDIAVKKDLLPMKVLITLPYLKNYIRENRMDIMESSVKYILPNRETILNFSLDQLEELDELDDDTDDNVSRIGYKSNIDIIKSNIEKEKKSLKNGIKDMESNEILNIIVEIKNNSKKLSKKDTDIIYQYIKLLILVLEEIKKLFD